MNRIESRRSPRGSALNIRTGVASRKMSRPLLRTPANTGKMLQVSPSRGAVVPSTRPSAATSVRHYHYHVLALDGVVSGDVERGVRFHEAARIEARDAVALARTVQLRV